MCGKRENIERLKERDFEPEARIRTKWFGKITEIDEKLVSAKKKEKENSISVDAFEDKRKTSDLTA